MSDDVGVFARVSANDGSQEAYEFTEINRGVTTGVEDPLSCEPPRPLTAVNESAFGFLQAESGYQGKLPWRHSRICCLD